MSIGNSDVVDGLGISRVDGKAVLTIADHLEWRDSKSHFDLLEKKIGAYLSFVSSGQLYEMLPEARGKEIRIELIHEHAPNEMVVNFFVAVEKQLKSMGLEFTAKALPEDY
jgi:putative hemolysin